MLQKYLTYNAQRYASKWVVLLIDLITVAFSFALSYLIFFNLTFDFDVEQLLVQLPWVAIIALASFLLVGSHKGVVRHTGIRDVYNIFNAICLSSILLIFLVITSRQLGFIPLLTIPLSIIIINSLISFVALTFSRFVYKAMYQQVTLGVRPNKIVLIYGAGNSGILTFGALTNHSKGDSKVIGYIDNDNKKVGKKINGIPVFAEGILNKSFIDKNNVSEIIFSVQNIDSKELRKKVEALVDLPVLVKIVPPIEDWINGELKVSQIKKVQIEDLLNRTPINFKNYKIDNELRNKSIMVTGGAGSIGSELVRQICEYGYRNLIIIDQAESALYDLQQELKQNGFRNFVPIVGDIRDKNRLNTIFEKYKPDLVFHAAAYKHVPLMEENPYESIRINIGGTKNIADLSITHQVSKFVLISTDKAVNPTNVMGASKRIAEMYVSCLQKESKTKFITTRFGNVLGSNGSVIPLFRKQIENGGPLTLTHMDITRYFMTIPEASQLVLEAGAMGEGGEIFVFDMGESVKIYDLAKNMIKLSGLNYPEDIDIKITGLRPGEKLHEELLANGENTLPTYHKKIKISKVREVNFVNFKPKIDELCITNMFLDGNAVDLMRRIVPEYGTENCILDNNNKSSIDNTELKIVEQ